ncbi:MAG: hypothetical protein ACFCD0_27315 [Gemmataceae bacterium]
MSSVFTDHVRHFGHESDAAQKVLPALERLLKRKMREKNLLTAPPSYLGYLEIQDWTAHNAFEDIVADCYIFAILDRLQRLQGQLKAKPNIDGLISRNVNNFLFERQRTHDPIGYAIFCNVKNSFLEIATTQGGRLENLEKGKVHNGTILKLDPNQHEIPLGAENDIRNALQTATPLKDVLPHLVKTTQEGGDWITGFLGQLREAGIRALRCGDLVSTLANYVRTEWTARHTESASELAWEGDEEFQAIVRMVWPDKGLETQENWEELKRELPERIANMNRQTRVRERLGKVFAVLVEAIEGGNRDTVTQVELTARTGIPRATLSDDFRILQEILSEFLGENSDM